MSQPYRLLLHANGQRWLNANDRLHWAPKARITAYWRVLAALEAKRKRIPALHCGRVIVYLHFPTAHRRDPANWAPTAKACIDGLVDAGVFDDDDHKHVVGPDMRIGSIAPAGQHGLTLVIYKGLE